MNQRIKTFSECSRSLHHVDDVSEQYKEKHAVHHLNIKSIFTQFSYELLHLFKRKNSECTPHLSFTTLMQIKKSKQFPFYM